MNEVIRVITCLFNKKILHAQKKSIKSKQATFTQIIFIRIEKHKKQTSDFRLDVFYTHKKQRSHFHSDVFFIHTKKHKMPKKHKEHKKQTSDFHSDVYFIRVKNIKSIKSAKSTKTSNKGLSSS